MSIFCPTELAWGNVATWFTGLATFAAVGVALLNARGAARLATELHEREKQDQAERDVNTAKRLAIVIDHELYMWGGILRTVVEQEYPHALDVILNAERLLPKEPMPLTSRFAPELGVFGGEDGAAIMKVLAQAQIIGSGPSPEDIDEAPEPIQRYAADAILQTLRGALSLVDGARAKLEPWLAAQGIEQTDLDEVSDQINAELRAND